MGLGGISRAVSDFMFPLHPSSIPLARGVLHKDATFLGFSIGFWAVLNTNAAEQFGTNLRATVATSVPNFVRALLIPMSIAFALFKPVAGLRGGAVIISVIAAVTAIGATCLLKEKFGHDLDVVHNFWGYTIPRPRTCTKGAPFVRYSWASCSRRAHCSAFQMLIAAEWWPPPSVHRAPHFPMKTTLPT